MFSCPCFSRRRCQLATRQGETTGRQTYTITQLDTGANVASSAQLISDNGVVAGNLQDGSEFSFVWSAQTGFVVLTLGHRRQRERHRYRRRRYAGGELLGFIWTPAEGLVTIGDLGGGLTIGQGVTSSGLVVGSSRIPGGPEHAFMWTKAGGIVDLGPTGLVDSTGRFATEDGNLIIGSIVAETGWRIFAWTERQACPISARSVATCCRSYMNRQGALTGFVQREDGTGQGTFFWSQTNGLEDIGSLGGDEIRPTAINDAGTIVGFGTTASGETHGFVWSKANGLVDIGTLGGDFSWASHLNSSGLVTGYSKTPSGDDHAIAWTEDGGLIDLGTLGGINSRGDFVTETGAIIGESGTKGHRRHAFIWTADVGMVEMPSLGRFETVDVASSNGLFAGHTFDKKTNALHAVLWAPSPASSKR